MHVGSKLVQVFKVSFDLLNHPQITNQEYSYQIE